MKKVALARNAKTNHIFVEIDQVQNDVLNSDLVNPLKHVLESTYCTVCVCVTDLSLRGNFTYNCFLPVFSMSKYPNSKFRGSAVL